MLWVSRSFLFDEILGLILFVLSVLYLGFDPLFCSCVFRYGIDWIIGLPCSSLDQVQLFLNDLLRFSVGFVPSTVNGE